MRGGRAISTTIATLGLVACAAIAGLDDPGSEDREPDAATTIDATVPPSEVGPVPDAEPPIDAPAMDVRAQNLGCEAGASSMLVGYWRMDEGSGVDVRDCTAGARHGKRTGANDWIPGKKGPFALSFDGGQVGFGNQAGFGITGAISVSAWVRIATFAGAGRILSKGGGTNNRGWELNVESSGVGVFKVAIGADVHHEAVSPPLPLDTWIHLIGVYEPNVAARLYVNGALAAANGDAGASHRDTSYQVMVGNRPGDFCCPFFGQVDDVRLFARVLDDVDIAMLATP